MPAALLLIWVSSLIHVIHHGAALLLLLSHHHGIVRTFPVVPVVIIVVITLNIMRRRDKAEGSEMAIKSILLGQNETFYDYLPIVVPFLRTDLLVETHPGLLHLVLGSPVVENLEVPHDPYSNTTVAD